MTDVLIRDLDDESLERLKKRARLHGRSLQGELKRIVEQAALVDEDKFWQGVDAIREKLKDAGDLGPDSAELLRRDRDEH